MSHQLEQLFRQCDHRGNGFIDQSEFRDLCRGFDIADPDADIIFYDLDHDGDGRISFEDFSFGFRDFLTPGARRGSIQMGINTASSPSHKKSSDLKFKFSDSVAFENSFDETEEFIRKRDDMERKHRDAQAAWRNFADQLGKEDIKNVLSVR